MPYSMWIEVRSVIPSLGSVCFVDYVPKGPEFTMISPMRIPWIGYVVEGILIIWENNVPLNILLKILFP